MIHTRDESLSSQSLLLLLLFLFVQFLMISDVQIYNSVRISSLEKGNYF